MEITFDKLPFNFCRDVIDLASINKPSLLLEWRLVNSHWKQFVESVLNMRSWNLQRRRLNFSRLTLINDFDTNSRILRGLETLIENDTNYSLTNPETLFAGELSNVKQFLDSPKLKRNVLFLHGSAGNGTTFLLNSIAKVYSNQYYVQSISGSFYNAIPSSDRIENLVTSLLDKPKSLLIIDDTDKILLDYMRGMADLNNTMDWYTQKDTLISLFGTIQKSDKNCRIIISSNGSSLFTEELGKYIEQIVQIPYKNQKDRLRLLHEFTKEVKLSDDILLEETVRRLNGHVVRALKCVCQRAASISILRGFRCIEPICFDKAIQYVRNFYWK